MIGLGYTLTGKGFGPFDLNMKGLHQDLGDAQVQLISNRVEAGKTLTGGAMPPSLRVLNALGGSDTTLKDTGEMLDQSMKPWTVTERKAVISFAGQNAKKAAWNHYGAKTRNGKWRPRPRPFFGFNPGDRAVLVETVDNYLDYAAKKASA